MYQSEDYLVHRLRGNDEARLSGELERHRRIAERIAERAAETAELQVTDAPRPTFLVRWRRRLGLPTGPVFGTGNGHGGGPAALAS